MAKEPAGMMAPEDDDGAMAEDAEGSMKPEDDEDDDEGGEEAALRTATSDFLAAIGVKPKKLDEAVAAFKEMMEHCKPGDY